MQPRTRHTNAMATEPSSQATHVATMDTQRPLAIRSTHTNSATIAQSSHAAEMPDKSFKHQTNSKRTNWRNLKEQALRDQSKKREVLNAVNLNT